MNKVIADTRRAMGEVIHAAGHTPQPRARFMAGLGINLIGATLLFCEAIALIASPL